MSKDEGNPNDEARTEVKAATHFPSFELRHSFVIRHLNFGIGNRSWLTTL
jgi:hypothetical protein